MQLQDPRKLITVELPSYPGSEIMMYTDLTEKQKRTVQVKYSNVLNAIIKNQAALQGIDDPSKVSEGLQGMNISELTEMSVYQYFLHIKSWNFTDESGNIVPLEFDTFDAMLMEADIAHLRELIDEKKKNDLLKKKESSEETSLAEKM